MSEEQLNPQPNGLSQKHWDELNSQLSNRPERCEQLRPEYRGDPLALRQIDQFDPCSEHSRMIEEIVQAYEEKDLEKIATLKAWFEGFKHKYETES